MNILEAATVNDGRADWLGGYNAQSRECGMQMRLTDACEEESIELVGDENSTVAEYFVKPFAIEAQLNRSVVCERPDDVAWVKKVLEKNLDYPLSRALVIQPIAGTDSWIGDASVPTVTLPATPTADQYGTAILEARAQWFENNMSINGGPILHVPPRLVITLVKAGILSMKADGDAATILGDRVVIGTGYDRTNANVFYSGEVKIYYTSVDTNDILRRARLNNSVILANLIALVDVAPCSIVRVGSYS